LGQRRKAAGLLHSKTLARTFACRFFREVFECGSPIPLSAITYFECTYKLSLRGVFIDDGLHGARLWKELRSGYPAMANAIIGGSLASDVWWSYYWEFCCREAITVNAANQHRRIKLLEAQLALPTVRAWIVLAHDTLTLDRPRAPRKSWRPS
jgi:hypothetical protein